jgi:hypothetical protein
VQLILELAGSDNPAAGAAQAQSGVKLEDGDRQALRRLLAANQISDPEKTLADVRDMARQIERSNPELASDVRQRLAIIQEAESQFVSHVHDWFDRTMDRVSERFTAWIRGVTYAVAVGVVLFLQLDVVALVDRLYMDDAARKAFVEQVAPAALEAQRQADALPPTANDQDKAAVDVKAEVKMLRERVAKANSALSTQEVLPLPADWNPLHAQWSFSKAFGMLLAAILLGLGAPFWYKALSTVLQLRSLAAQHDDAQRAARSAGATDASAAASSPTAPATMAAAAASSGPPQWLRGERGDIAAAG